MIKPEKLILYLQIIIFSSIIFGGVISVAVKWFIIPTMKKEYKYFEYCFDEILTDKQRLDALERFETYKETGIYVPVKTN